MTQIDRSALVLHSAKQMYDVVNDVHLYPQFLPWCSASNILSQSDTQMVASLELAKAGIKYTFSTRNELVIGQSIKFELEDGPFESLFGQWQFVALSDSACKVNLSMHFGFSGKIAAFAMSKVFAQVANTMVEAFVQRAAELYKIEK